MSKNKKHRTPCIILIGGYSGTGKSTLSRALQTALPEKDNWVVLDADVIRKELMGVDPLTRLPDSAYTQQMHIRLQEEMFRRMEACLKQGRSVIANSVFLGAKTRDQVEKRIEGYGLPMAGIFLTADRPTLEKRIKNRTDDASDMTVEKLGKQFNDKKIVFGNFWRVLDSRQRPDQVLSAALDYIKQELQQKPYNPPHSPSAAPHQKRN